MAADAIGLLAVLVSGPKEKTQVFIFFSSQVVQTFEFHVQQNSNEKPLNSLGLLLFGDVFFLGSKSKAKKASKNIFLVYLFVITGTHSETQ